MLSKESGWIFLCLTRIGVCICPGGQRQDEVMPSLSSQQAEDPPPPPLSSLGDAGPWLCFSGRHYITYQQ